MGSPMLGTKIKELREARGLTLKEVATTTGISASLLSMAERGERSISMDKLSRLAEFFHVSLAEFFLDRADGGTRLIRKDARRKLMLPDNGIIFELLTPDLNRSIELVLQTVQPKHGSETPYRDEGEEAIYVIAGTLDVTVGETLYQLSAGDCLLIQREAPYRWINNGQDTSVSLWISSSPGY